MAWNAWPVFRRHTQYERVVRELAAEAADIVLLGARRGSPPAGSRRRRGYLLALASHAVAELRSNLAYPVNLGETEQVRLSESVRELAVDLALRQLSVPSPALSRAA